MPLIVQSPKGGIATEKFIPYEKLSKREKRKLDAARRNTWGSLNPATRRPENPKAYKRKKLRIEENDLDPQLFLPPPPPRSRLPS